MKHLKILALAVAATAFVVPDTSSAAHTLCTVTETECRGAGNMWGPGKAGMETIRAIDTEGGGVTKSTLTATFGSLSCNSELESAIERTGGEGVETTPTGTAAKFTWTNCSGGTAATHQLGRVVFHWDAEHNGTVTLENFFVKIVQAGIPCYYSFTNVQGTLTGGNPAVIQITGEPKVIDDNAATNSSAFCPMGSPWHATYKITSGPVYLSHHLA